MNLRLQQQVEMLVAWSKNCLLACNPIVFDRCESCRVISVKTADMALGRKRNQAETEAVFVKLSDSVVLFCV